MRKQILTLAVLAAFTAPAAAQSTYDDSAANAGAGANSGIVQPGSSNDVGDSIDRGTTGSIDGGYRVEVNRNSENGSGIDPSSNPQSHLFGSNSR